MGASQIGWVRDWDEAQRLRLGTPADGAAEAGTVRALHGMELPEVSRMEARSHPLSSLAVALVLAASCDAPPAASEGPRPRVGGPPTSVTIDPVRLCPMVDGRPFFAIGACGIPPEQMKACADAGLNLTIRWGNPAWCDPGYAEALVAGGDAPAGYLRRYLDAAAAAGLFVVEHPLLFPEKSLLLGDAFAANLDEFMAERLPQVIGAVKSHPALFGYYGPEEFLGQYLPAVAEYTHAVRQHDLTHPVFLVASWGTYDLTHDAWQSWGADLGITADDCYPAPDARRLTPAFVRAQTHSAWARESGRAFWWLPLMSYYSSRKPYPLSPQAQRAQVYLALIGGANGFVWCSWAPRHVDTWDAIKRTVREIRCLEPVLLEPVVPTPVEWSPAVCRETVQARAVKHEGKTWLLTANAYAADAQVRVQLPASVQTASVCFEDRDVPIVDGVLTDRFGGFACHVYEIADQWPDDATLRIAVDPSPMPIEVGPWPGAGFSILPDNLIVDPGFEDSTAWFFNGFGRAPARCGGDLGTGLTLAGAASAHVGLSEGGGTPGWFGQPITLKPNTRYLVGGHMSTDMRDPCWVRLGLCGGQSLRPQLVTTQQADPVSGWGRYSLLYSTGAEPEEVRPTAGCEGGVGNAWFDDLFLHEACPGVRNLVANGGFEGPEVAEGWPVNWNNDYSLEIPGHIGSDGALWGVDDTVAFEGEHSLRMVHPGVRQLGGKHIPLASQMLLPGTELGEGRPYVFSAQMRASRADLVVQVQAGYGVSACTRDVRVGTGWSRQIVRVTGESSGEPVVVMLVCGEGTLWVDAVQFEPGTEPTDFQQWWY